MFGNSWFKKESPFTGLIGFGGGATSLASTSVKGWSATGGNTDGLAPGNGYTYHTFTSPGNLVITGRAPQAKKCEVFMMGGGGSGSDANASLVGAGAGGMVYHTDVPLDGQDGTIAITVGGGGQGGEGSGGANPGGNSTMVWPNGAKTTITALGGANCTSAKGGETIPQMQGQTCGCGAGGFGVGSGLYDQVNGGEGKQPQQNPSYTPNPEFAQWGYDGGAGYSQHYKWQGGGGGGCGGAGEDSPLAGGSGDNNGGQGRQQPAFQGPLIGLPGLNPLNGYFGGGGGGGNENYPSYPAPQGSAAAPGGGGASAPNSGPFNAVQNSGGGGGGPFYGSGADGGNGGDGIVVIRYPT